MYQRFDDYDKMRRAKKNKNELTILKMACDLYNYFPSTSKRKIKPVYNESERLADQMVDKILNEVKTLEDLMAFMAAVMKVRAYIDKALPFTIGPNAQYASYLLEEKYCDDGWMCMHQDRIVIKLEDLYRELIGKK